MMDRKVIRLIIKFLRAGYINMYSIKDLELDQRKGVPQGSILGPLFSNIAFNYIDKVMNTYTSEFNNNYSYSKKSSYKDEF